MADDDHKPLAPGLYVVPTPIGNLEDITLRALRILREVDSIACEDTRHTQKLLNHFNISKPRYSYHEHNEAARAQEIVERIARGERVALVSDAGMPGISDPGQRVIQAVIAGSLKVVVLPGPSASIAALVASGLPTDGYRFVGFLPSRTGERRTALEQLRAAAETIVFYEAPHRLLEMLSDLEDILGPERKLAVARELTKIHEEILRGSVSQVRAELQQRDSVKGEIVVIVGGEHGSESGNIEKQSLPQRMCEILNAGELDEKEALKEVAREFGVSKSEAYREWQRKKASTRRHRGTEKS